MGWGSNLSSSGKLLANGTASSPITFSSISGTSPGSWGSIILNGMGAHQSKISNAVITFATEIRVNYVQPPNNYFTIDSVTFNSTVNAVKTYGSNGWIMNSKIQYPQDHGIVAQNGSTIACYNNTITKSNQSGAAILYTSDSYDYIWNNTIRGFNRGIGSSYGARAKCGHPSNSGDNNTITQCVIGAKVYEDGFGMFGYFDEDFDPYYTGNTIDSSATYDVECFTNSETNGYGVNWGASGPVYSVFDNSYFYYGCGFCKTQSSRGDQILSARIRREGEKLRMAKKYTEAVQLFTSELMKNSQEESAYAGLFEIFNDTTAKEILTLFASLPKDAPPLARFMQASLYLRIGEVESAKQINASLIKEYPESNISERAKLNNFYITLYDENKPSVAKMILDELLLNPGLTTDIDVSLARHSLKTFVPSAFVNHGQMKKQAPVTQQPVPERFALSQNYPNPFNPSTTISYSIPNAGNTTLNVYDAIGRKVAALVNEMKEPGYYSVTMDGSQLSSGVYIYKLISGSFTQTKKMMLVK